MIDPTLPLIDLHRHLDTNVRLETILDLGQRPIRCSHCGASLEITNGASGHPMAMLVSIEEDTSLLALEAQYQRLKQTVAEREKNHQEWVDLLRETRETLSKLDIEHVRI